MFKDVAPSFRGRQKRIGIGFSFLIVLRKQTMSLLQLMGNTRMKTMSATAR